MSPRLSAPDRDAAEVRDRREMHQESDAELLKVRATGNECKKELAQEEPEHREDGPQLFEDDLILRQDLDGYKDHPHGPTD